MSKRLTCFLLVAGLALAAQAQPAATPSGANGNQTNSAPIDPHMKSMLTLAAQMNVFRLSAGFNANRAIEVWAGPKFQAKWQQEVQPLFSASGDQQQIHDFFSSAVVLLGRTGDRGRGVAGFYNPWQDGLLLIAVGPGMEHPVLEDFCFIAGETWRGETVKTGEDILTLYMLKEPLTITLARKYAATVEKFNRLYPVNAPFILLPDEGKLGVGSTVIELAPIKARMLYRAKMFNVLFEKENKSAVLVARELRALLNGGDEAKLAAYLSPKQNKEMLHTICQMPAPMRNNLAPNYFVRNASAGGSIIALVNSKTPRWLFAVQMLESDPIPRVSIEAMDMEASSFILEKLKGKK